MQHLRGCQLAVPVRAVGAGKNAVLSTEVVQSDETEKQCSHSCLTMTTAVTLGLETQTSSQHLIVILVIVIKRCKHVAMFENVHGRRKRETNIIIMMIIYLSKFSSLQPVVKIAKCTMPGHFTFQNNNSNFRCKYTCNSDSRFSRF